MEPSQPKGKKTTEARKGRQPRECKVKWVNVSAAQASGQDVHLSAHNLASEIYTQYLTLTEHQQAEFTMLEHFIEDTTFNPHSEAEQLEAAALLASNSLDLDARESIGSRWSNRWGATTGKDGRQIRRSLYQWYFIFSVSNGHTTDIHTC